jgi:regulator of RNase E activity RraA
MTMGFQIFPRPTDPTRVASVAQVAAARALATCLLSDNMGRLTGDAGRLRPIHPLTAVVDLCGPAFTVRTRPGDNLIIHKAIDLIRPGEVLVIDGGGELSNALIGEIMATIAKKNGAAGAVIDGAIRDAGALATMGFPIYAAGYSHRGPYKDGPGEIGGVISVAGMVVNPGDLMVCDADGVLAIAAQEADAVIQAAQDQLAKEAVILKAIADGTLDRSWVDAALAARGCRI